MPLSSYQLFSQIKFEYKIAFAYLILGFLWIFFSDTIFDRIIEEKSILTAINLTKGFLYVIITSILLYYLIKKHINRLQIAESLITQRSHEIQMQNKRYIQLNEDLKISKEKAEESDRLKTAFLANMSHEIRTPMNGILGFTTLLKEPDLTGDQQSQFIEIIEKSGSRMLNIINDIIDISRIESGQISINLSESSLNEQLKYLYSLFKLEAESKGLSFSYNCILSDCESIFYTDWEKVYAIFANLIKNSIKYTKTGSIQFGYQIQHQSLIEFYVKDTGMGIPKDRQDAIFERFIQADIEDKMANQGAGLGLAISKAYCDMLGGKIWVESEVGKGSTFFFSIPRNYLT